MVLKLPRVLLSTLLVLIAAAGSQAGDTITKTFPVPQRGALAITYPKTWRVAVQQRPNNQPTEISLKPARGGEVLVTLTPLWSPTGDPNFASDAKVKEHAETLKGFLAPGAVERNLELTELKGANAHGYFCTIKDKAWRQGDYEYMTSLAVGTGELMITGTILSHSKESQEFKDSFKVFEALEHKKPGAKKK